MGIQESMKDIRSHEKNQAGSGNRHQNACWIHDSAYAWLPIAAALASIILSTRNRHYRLAEAEEAVDTDQDGIPDV